MFGLAKYLSLVKDYIKLNWRIHMQYRGAFIAQAAAMFLNNGAWLAYWTLFFTTFPVIRGWTVSDVITLWAITTAGFGLAHTFCGNAHVLATIISRGKLDAWLLYPRALLPHLVLGRMSATAIGDAIFGYFIYIVLIRPDWPHFLLFTELTLSVAILFLGFSIGAGSLAFFLGNAEILYEQMFFSMVTFSTYPFALFDGWVRVVLYTVIPAAFVSHFPVEALRHLSLADAGFALLGSIAVLFVGVSVFYVGLKRYESGNLIELRA